jgi:hypothetical protein
MQNRYALLGLILSLATTAFAQDTVHTSVSADVFSRSAHFSAAPQFLQGQVVAGSPYSAEETQTTVQTLADGTHITHLASTRRLYRDSAGRTRTEHSLLLSAAARKQKADVPVIIEIIDPVEHVKYTLDNVNKVAHKQVVSAVHTKKHAAEHAQVADEEAPKTIHEKLGNQTMEGLRVEGTRYTIVYPTGSEGNDRPMTVVHESWWSPDLKVIVISTDNDPRNGESTRKLTNVDRSEPDPSLFVPPADYTVVEEKGDFTIKWGSEK